MSFPDKRLRSSIGISLFQARKIYTRGVVLEEEQLGFMHEDDFLTMNMVHAVLGTRIMNQINNNVES